jgi:hypothetical protein
LGATWTGAGINSSSAAQANAAEPELRSIAYAENATLPLGPYTTFRGQPVDSTSILIGYTRTGDANLDGLVNDDDVTILGATYAPGVPRPSWALGDYDYDGFVDDDEVTLLGAFYDPARVVISLREMEHAHQEDSLGEMNPLANKAISLRELIPLAEREVYGDYASANAQLLADADDSFLPKRKQRAAVAR